MLVRKPAVAGQFYPLEKSSLLKYLETDDKTSEIMNAIAGISPHAGYMYSGDVAKKLFISIGNDVRCFIILGPNHTGLGKPISVYPPGYWETPLGQIKINNRVESLVDEQVIFLDEEAHLFEHSIEVQIPFIQYRFPKAEIIPICVMDQRKDTMLYLAKKILEISEKGDLVLASSDLTHFEPSIIARQKDNALIQKILEYDVDGLYYMIDYLRISACGYGPIAVAMYYAKEKGSKKSKLIEYKDSSTVTGDSSEVVGYASVIFY